MNASLDYDASTVTSEAGWATQKESLCVTYEIAVFSKAQFRRQHPIERYILDFYCASCRLAIELDGGGHNEPAKKRHDAERTEFLNKEGIEVVRFWNHMVLRKIDSVLGTIDIALERRSKEHPSP